jgi:hypothetical protein
LRVVALRLAASDAPGRARTLRLYECTTLTSVADLPAGVQTLILSVCTGLTEVGRLPAGLQLVLLSDTPGLPEAVKAEIRELVKRNGGEVME